MLGGSGRMPESSPAALPPPKPEKLELAQGVQSAAQTADVGELFQYVIADPVSLRRQQSSMLPIVNASVDAKKVSIFNPEIHAKHPLNALRLTNSTDLHLKQGPITVFDGGAYAGDARIEDLAPKSERLVSYALDLDTELAHEAKTHPETLVAVKIVRGTLQTTRKHLREQQYAARNSSDRPKDILIEYPNDANWKLADPKEPTEKTASLYRFLVQVKAGESTTFSVREEQLVDQQFAVSSLDSDAIRVYVSSRVVSDAVKKALESVVTRQAAVNDTVHQRTQFEQQLASIQDEQSRIRQNMVQLDRTSDLYRRYVKKFGEQEDEVESLGATVKQLRAQENTQRSELDKFVAALTVS
jgi:hypothetical protein